MRVQFSESDKLQLLAKNISEASSPEDAQKQLAEYVTQLEQETEQEVKEDLGESFRNKFSKFVLTVFILNSMVVLLIVAAAFSIDAWYLYSKAITAADRLVDSKVLMVLIAGTVTQTALAFGILTQYVFKVFNSKNSD